MRQPTGAPARGAPVACVIWVHSMILALVETIDVDPTLHNAAQVPFVLIVP